MLLKNSPEYSDIQNNTAFVRYNEETDYIQAFYDGAWNNVLFAALQNFWLYKANNEYTELTGGWSTYGNAGDVNKYSDHIYMFFPSSTSGSIQIQTAKPVNFQGFNKLVIEMELSGRYAIVLSNSYFVPLQAANLSRRKYEYDISQFQGSYIVCLRVASNDTNSGFMSVYGIYLS